LARILTYGDSPLISSGYGLILKRINEALKKEGHEVACLAVFQTRPVIYDYPLFNVSEDDLFGFKIFDEVIYTFEPDIVFSLMDIYAIVHVKNSLFRDSFAFCYYVPVDSGPLPSFWEAPLRDVDNLFAYTYYGKQELKKFLGIDVDVIYPGYDDAVFYPMDKEQVKKEFGMEGKFVVGYVGVNALRKMPVRLIEAFSLVVKKHPEAVLFMHTDAYNEKEGWDLMEAARQVGLHPGQIFFSSRSGPFGISDIALAKLYNLFDVLALPSKCEGFGLPILEAAACGVPTVATNYSAITELVENRGELVKPEAWMMHRPYCQQRPLVSIKMLASRINKLIENRQLLNLYSERCIEWAKQYTWSNQLPKFVNKILATERKKSESENYKIHKLLVV